MIILKLFFFTLFSKYISQSTVDLKINKKISLLRHVSEESYIIEGTNHMSRSLKEFKFRINPKLYDKLRIIVTHQDKSETKQTSKIDQNLFKIIFKKPIKTDETFFIRINLYFFNNYIFRPYKIKMREDQMVEYNDNLLNLEFDNFISIEYMHTIYLLTKKAKKYPSKQTSEIKVLESGYIKYTLKQFIRETKNFKNQKIKFYFAMNNAFDIFTSYKRDLDISLWGNIKETNKIDITNKGAELDGEFSNIDFIPTDPQTGKNSLRWMTTQLPGELSGLSITDEIGNVTKPIAHKRDNSIVLNLIPRFPLFGKWKSSWFISYNQKTTKFLFRNFREENVFKFSYKFGFAFEDVLAEEYFLAFCLPEFSQVLEVRMPYEFEEREEFKSYGYFEYFGKNCLRYKFKNILPQLFDKDFEVYFKYNPVFLWLKFFIVTFMISGIFFLAFLCKRLDFGLDTLSKNEKLKKD